MIDGDFRKMYPQTDILKQIEEINQKKVEAAMLTQKIKDLEVKKKMKKYEKKYKTNMTVIKEEDDSVVNHSQSQVDDNQKITKKLKKSRSDENKQGVPAYKQQATYQDNLIKWCKSAGMNTQR